MLSAASETPSTASRPSVVNVFLNPIYPLPYGIGSNFVSSVYKLLDSRAIADFVGSALEDRVAGLEWAEYFHQVAGACSSHHVYPFGFSVAYTNYESTLGGGHDTAGRHEE